MNSNNIVVFPKEYNGPEKNVNYNIIERNIDMMKHFHIQETIGNLAPMIFNQLEISGFDVEYDSPEGIKDGALIIESLRALMCKHYDIYHPFQKIADEIFVSDGGEEGSLKIVDDLIVNLKQ